MIRALTGLVGLSVQQARTILELIDDPGDDLYQDLGSAVSAGLLLSMRQLVDDPDPYPRARGASRRSGRSTTPGSPPSPSSRPHSPRPRPPACR